MIHTIPVWWCSLCREDVQAGAKPDVCSFCNKADNLVVFSIPYVAENPTDKP